MAAPITLLRARAGKTFAKTIGGTPGAWTKRVYDDVYLIDADHLEIADLEELSALLSSIESNPKACLIRGRLIAGDSAMRIRRLSHDKPDAVATFADQETNIICLDIDDLIVPPDLTLAERLAHVLRVIPAPFREADFHYQWSSSAGLNGWTTLKIHLWFWLDQPVTTEYLRERSTDEKWAVDRQLFKTVQPHYTSAPVFKDHPDPLAGQRSGFVRRALRTVVLPSWSPAPPPIYTYTGPIVATDDRAYAERIGKWVAACLSGTAAHIIEAPDGEQNNIICAAAYSLGRLVGGGHISRTDAENHLEAASAAGGHPRARYRPTIRSGLSDGIRRPRHSPDDR